MATNIDSRGVIRLECKKEDCDCEEYEAPPQGTPGSQCMYCEHPAPAHVKGGKAPKPDTTPAVPTPSAPPQVDDARGKEEVEDEEDEEEEVPGGEEEDGMDEMDDAWGDSDEDGFGLVAEEGGGLGGEVDFAGMPDAPEDVEGEVEGEGVGAGIPILPWSPQGGFVVDEDVIPDGIPDMPPPPYQSFSGSDSESGSDEDDGVNGGGDGDGGAREKDVTLEEDDGVGMGMGGMFPGMTGETRCLKEKCSCMCLVSDGAGIECSYCGHLTEDHAVPGEMALPKVEVTACSHDDCECTAFLRYENETGCDYCGHAETHHAGPGGDIPDVSLDPGLADKPFRGGCTVARCACQIYMPEPPTGVLCDYCDHVDDRHALIGPCLDYGCPCSGFVLNPPGLSCADCPHSLLAHTIGQAPVAAQPPQPPAASAPPPTTPTPAPTPTPVHTPGMCAAPSCPAPAHGVFNACTQDHYDVIAPALKPTCGVPTCSRPCFFNSPACSRRHYSALQS